MKCCLESCSNPARLTIEDKETLREISICFNCFNETHAVKNCFEVLE